MFVKTNGSDISLSSTSDIMLKATVDGSVDLYHDNSKKLATTSTGIDVTGDTDTSGLFRFGTNNSEIANNYVRFKPSGAAYIDHNTVGQVINFRVSASSSLDTTAMTITNSGKLQNPAHGTTSTGANCYMTSADGEFKRSTSSIKYKKDVETIEDSYADAVLNFRPVWFRSKCEGDNPDWGYWGLIAEEVAEIDSRLV